MIARGIALLAVLVIIAGCGTDEPTACEGFAGRKLGITGAEYRGCAGEILAALDSIEPPLRAIVSERANDEDRNTARRDLTLLVENPEPREGQPRLNAIPLGM